MKRPRSSWGAGHESVGPCRTCAPGNGENEVMCMCMCDSQNKLKAPLFSSWEQAKSASLNANLLTRSGARDAVHNVSQLLRIRELSTNSASGVGMRLALDRAIERSRIKAGSRHEFDVPETSKSTISVSCSTDGRLVASTHGDHTIKVFDAETLRQVACLRGHPRTPWTVKFHPTNANRLASGCLGCHVRIWDIAAEKTMAIAQLNSEVVSIGFHPHREWLAMASGKSLLLWDYGNPDASPVKVLVRRRNVRCVSFTPCGTQLITGEATPNECPSSIHHINKRAEVTVQLLAWNFDTNCAKQWLLERLSYDEPRIRLSDVRSLQGAAVPSAVLYSDGGFDISPCGRFLCAVSFTAPGKAPIQEKSQDVTMKPRPLGQVPLPRPDRGVASARGPPRVPLGRGSDPSNAANSADERLGIRPSSCQDHRAQVSTIARRVDSIDLHDPVSTTPQQPQGSHDNPPAVRTGTIRREPQVSSSLHFAAQGRYGRLAGEQDQSLYATPVDSKRRVAARPPALGQGGGAVSSANATFETNSSHAQQARSRGNRTTFVSRAARRAHLAQSTVAAASRRVQGSHINFGIYKLVLVSLEPSRLGEVHSATTLSNSQACGITSVKLSTTLHSVVVGYGGRWRPCVEAEGSTGESRVVLVFGYADNRRRMEELRCIMSRNEDANIACFHPRPGHGLIYGTRQGRLIAIR